MSDLTPEQRDIYAEPGTLLRRMLDAGVVAWPTLEQARHEGHLADVFESGHTTLRDETGNAIGEVDYREGWRP